MDNVGSFELRHPIRSLRHQMKSRMRQIVDRASARCAKFGIPPRNVSTVPKFKTGGCSETISHAHNVLFRYDAEGCLAGAP